MHLKTKKTLQKYKSKHRILPTTTKSYRVLIITKLNKFLEYLLQQHNFHITFKSFTIFPFFYNPIDYISCVFLVPNETCCTPHQNSPSKFSHPN
jgi:hypothetical protein